MIKGSLLLVAQSVLESRIITSFLEAADYEVTEFLMLSAQGQPPRRRHFGAAVLILENEDSDLVATSDLIRKVTQQEHLPIIVVATEAPAEATKGLRILLRPIRLFDLVHAVDEAVADSRHNNSAEPPNYALSMHRS